MSKPQHIWNIAVTIPLSVLNATPSIPASVWETPQQNVAPPQAEPERLRPVRQKKKIDRYGQNIYDT